MSVCVLEDLGHKPKIAHSQGCFDWRFFLLQNLELPNLDSVRSSALSLTVVVCEVADLLEDVLPGGDESPDDVQRVHRMRHVVVILGSSRLQLFLHVFEGPEKYQSYASSKVPLFILSHRIQFKKWNRSVVFMVAVFLQRSDSLGVQ